MPGETDEEFRDPSSYPYLSVASPSCHDTSTTRAWYQQDPDRRQRYYNQVIMLLRSIDSQFPKKNKNLRASKYKRYAIQPR
jgi:4-alpha-glucanotransferase